MAGSRYEYVRKFESRSDACLLNTYIVVRVDGRNFHSFTTENNFVKPNDTRSLELMNLAAKECMKAFSDIFLAYGQSDEYSFAFHRKSTLFSRRASKLVSCVVSLFTAAYVQHWSTFFKTPCASLPHFDGRVVCYPTDENLRDYFSWRQVDCHINNLYNTCFWNLIKKKHLTPSAAKTRLDGTLAKDKHEILFTELGLNYNGEPAMFKKGSVWVRGDKKHQEEPFQLCHVDIIGDTFWKTVALSK